MKRSLPFCLILAALAVLVAVPMHRSVAATPFTASSVQKWEYAELTFANKVSFATADSYTEENDVADLLQKLGGKVEELKEASPPSSIRRTQVAILNLIGSQGWELVSAVDPGGAIIRYVFKRPASK